MRKEEYVPAPTCPVERARIAEVPGRAKHDASYDVTRHRTNHHDDDRWRDSEDAVEITGHALNRS
jgi:hypothetical protein